MSFSESQLKVLDAFTTELREVLACASSLRPFIDAMEKTGLEFRGINLNILVASREDAPQAAMQANDEAFLRSLRIDPGDGVDPGGTR